MTATVATTEDAMQSADVLRVRCGLISRLCSALSQTCSAPLTVTRRLCAATWTAMSTEEKYNPEGRAGRMTTEAAVSTTAAAPSAFSRPSPKVRRTASQIRQQQAMDLLAASHCRKEKLGVTRG